MASRSARQHALRCCLTGRALIVESIAGALPMSHLQTLAKRGGGWNGVQEAAPCIISIQDVGHFSPDALSVYPRLCGCLCSQRSLEEQHHIKDPSAGVSETPR